MDPFQDTYHRPLGTGGINKSIFIYLYFFFLPTLTEKKLNLYRIDFKIDNICKNKINSHNCKYNCIVPQ